MSTAGRGSGRRMRAYAYTLVTTAIVLVFAVTEWLAERYLSDRSRAASTAVEIAIVLVAALVFRPIHQRAEKAVESAFYKRQHQALAALAKFRSELTSFSDMAQLLRRVIEAVEHHLDTSACAVYLRKGAFHAQASSFDVPAADVSADDPLAVRLRSSGAAAKPPQLQSAALGTHAFPMTAAGDLAGFLCVQCKDGDYDAEEAQMLAGLAADLAIAVIALDPALRGTRGKPNNIPADLAPMLGRERELAELKAALAASSLVTLTGAGGVGKTRIALQCASDLLEQYDDGAWFVNLAPIDNGNVIAATILSALDAGAGEGSEIDRAVEHLRPRRAFLLLDNCEHVVSDVARIVAQIRAKCPDVTILATSRESLHVRGEQIYRLEPLRTEAAVELFNQRASHVSPEFEPSVHAQAVRSICERLEGIPLAIELAAARMRAMSAAEILERLTERFRLLTAGARTSLPRQQTLAAAIEWSYGLLPPQEQSLFRRLSVFRGSFTLSAAAAVCAQDGRCDEYHVLDVLASLADKSLLVVTVALTTRYRLLETIREFASAKAVEQQAAGIAQHQHAAYFAGLASLAYHEFDSRLPAGWLDRLAPDIDNFRAALAWTLEGSGEHMAGAQLAADCGPMFMRLDLLAEGLRWCDAARTVTGLSAQTAARIDYVASMLYTNVDDRVRALECAQRALDLYEQTPDERGHIRALSQVAQLYARAKRFDDATAPANEAIRRARDLNEPRVLIGVLRRCAYSLPPSRIETARVYYTEAIERARSCGDQEEACRVLEWWATSEAACGEFERAIELALQGLACADRDSRLSLENQLACWQIALGHFEDAAPHVREAFKLGMEVQHPLRAFAVAYCAPLHVDRDPREAALVLGYAQARLAEIEHAVQPDDELAIRRALEAIERKLPGDEVTALLARGATLSEAEVTRILEPTLAGRGKPHDAPIAAGHGVDALLS